MNNSKIAQSESTPYFNLPTAAETTATEIIPTAQNGIMMNISDYLGIASSNMSNEAFIALMLTIVILMGMLTYIQVHKRTDEEIEETTVTVTKLKSKSRRK